jgi:hypothetical protein
MRELHFPWRTQPHEAVRASDWALSRGLISAPLVPLMTDVVTGLPLEWTGGGGPALDATDAGVGVRANNGRMLFSHFPSPITTTAYTIIARVSGVTTHGADRAVAALGGPGGNPSARLGSGPAAATNNKLRVWARTNIGVSPSTEVSTAQIAFDEATHIHAIAWDGSMLRAYLDGVPAETCPLAGGNMIFTASSLAGAMRSGVANTPWVSGVVGGGYFFREALSAHDIAALVDDFWLPFEPQRIWVPVLASAPAKAYALDAISGVYGLTGQTAGAVRGARAKASGGVYSMAGQAAAATVGRRLVAATGSYGLTGKTAGLLKERRLSATKGAYLIAGQAVSAKRVLKLGAGAGSYSLAGQAAALAASKLWRIAADTGTYTLSGQSAGRQVDRRLAAVRGTYTIAGQVAGLTYRVTGRLVAEGGAYALAGRPGLLSIARRLTAGSGAYALAGQPVRLGSGKAIVAAAGTYSLTGQGLKFKMSPALMAASGTYVLSGRGVELLYTSLTPDRTYPLTGKTQLYALSGMQQTYPLSGQSQR